MKRIWTLVNSTLVALSVFSGYNSMAPERLRHTNPDFIFCFAILLTMPIFAVLSVEYSLRRWKSDPLSRPSLDRNPFNWWGDPLQSLLFSTFVVSANGRGQCLPSPSAKICSFLDVRNVRLLR